MRVKKYVGATMQDTIFKVKAELGPDAIILNTRRYKKGFFGLFGKKQVEVLAAVEEKPKPEPENKKTLAEINNLKNMLHEITQKWQADGLINHLPDKISSLYQHLKLQEVENKLSQEFILDLNQTLETEAECLDELVNKLEHYLGAPEPIVVEGGRKVISFIGPTGVGKTTTIAKLAAKYALDQQLKVGLITADTFRIAAVQQLQTYCDIINVPLEVAYQESDLKQILTEKYADYDLVLIDTAGSSWNDRVQLGRLKGLLNRKIIDEIHLIISMNTKSTDIMGIIDRFSIFYPDKLLMTKMDETTTFGDLLNIKEKYKLPYSYITFGQDVPDDLQVAYPELLVEYLVGDYDE